MLHDAMLSLHSVAREDVECYLLGKTIDCSLWVTRNLPREGAGVHHSYTFHAIYSGFAVQDCFAVALLAHLAGASWVKNGVGALADYSFDLRIGLDAWAGVYLITNQRWLHSLCCEHLSHALEACDQDLHISWVGQPGWVDDWMVVGVLAVDRYIAAGERSNDGSCYCGVVLDVWRRKNVIVVVAGIRVLREVLDVWPVTAKFRIEVPAR